MSFSYGDINKNVKARLFMPKSPLSIIKGLQHDGSGLKLLRCRGGYRILERWGSG